jgi:hypothetical protein
MKSGLLSTTTTGPPPRLILRLIFASASDCGLQRSIPAKPVARKRDFFIDNSFLNRWMNSVLSVDFL